MAGPLAGAVAPSSPGSVPLAARLDPAYSSVRKRTARAAAGANFAADAAMPADEGCADGGPGGPGGQLWPVLPRLDGGGGALHALDRPRGPRAPVRFGPLQRPPARRAADVPDPPVQAPQGTGAGRHRGAP